MALYVITDGDGDDCSIVVEGLEKLRGKLKEFYENGTYDFTPGSTPQVYKLEKKINASVETIVTLKGE